MKTVKPAVEKRRYFRINDIIGLSYRILGDDNNQRKLALVDAGLPSTGLFAEIDREFNQVTNTLWHENPTIAQALGLLNRKISMIAEQNLLKQKEGQSEEQYASPYNELQANISACGMAFHCTEQLQEGTRLQLSVHLKPSDISLHLFGSVIACDHLRFNTEHNYWVRINFDETNDIAREQLIQHIVQKQCAQLNEKELKPGIN